IYGWRGAIDAMSTFAADHRLFLQKSFRFGTAGAPEAKKGLTLPEARIRIEGYEPVKSEGKQLEEIPQGAAGLCPTNREVIAQAMRAQAEGLRVAIVGGADAIKKLAEAALDLMNGRKSWHPELCAFSNWAAVQEYVQTEDAGTLKTMVRVIDTYGPEAI